MVTSTQRLEQVDFEGKEPTQIDELLRQRQTTLAKSCDLIHGISDDTVRAEVAKLHFGSPTAKALGFWSDGCDVTDMDRGGEPIDVMGDFVEK